MKSSVFKGAALFAAGAATAALASGLYPNEPITVGQFQERATVLIAEDQEHVDKVLPMLEAELGPGVAATLARTADLLRADTEYLDAVADSALESVLHQGSDGEQDGLSVSVLEELPGAIRTRVLRLAAVRAGALPAQLFHTHVLAIDKLVTEWHGQKWVELPGHVRASRSKDVLSFVREGPA